MADPITMAMMEEAAAAFLKDQAMQAMGPELSAMGGANAVGGLLGQTQTGMATSPPAPPPNPTSAQASVTIAYLCFLLHPQLNLA